MKNKLTNKEENMKTNEQNFSMMKGRLSYNPDSLFLDEEEKKLPIKYFINSKDWKINNRRIYLDNEQPKKGMGCTYSIGSDSYAYTVIDVKKNWKGKNFDIVTVQRTNDKAVSGDWYSWNVKYEYSENPDGKIHYLKSFNYKMTDGQTAKYYNFVRFNHATKRFNLSDQYASMSFGERRTSLDPHL